jgi:uncharacterized membrane protein YkvI
VNERVARAGVTLTAPRRAALALALLLPCMLVADRVGLVTLIAAGYRALAWALIAIYVLPLLWVTLLRATPARAPLPETP